MVKVAVGSGGFEPPKLAQLIYSQSHLATLVTAPMLSTPVHLSDQRAHYSRPFVACQALFDQIFQIEKTHTINASQYQHIHIDPLYKGRKSSAKALRLA